MRRGRKRHAWARADTHAHEHKEHTKWPYKDTHGHSPEHFRSRRGTRPRRSQHEGDPKQSLHHKTVQGLQTPLRGTTPKLALVTNNTCMVLTQTFIAELYRILHNLHLRYSPPTSTSMSSHSDSAK